MTQSSAEKLIARYLERVGDELADLPASERGEILEDLRSHIYEAIGDPRLATEADVRNVLDRVGDPEDVAREGRSRNSDATFAEPAAEVRHEPGRTPGALEVAAIILTALFWPIGVLLAWISDRWLTRDKVIATIIPFTTTLLLGVLVVGSMVAYGSYSTSVIVVSDDVQQAEPATPPGTSPGSSEPIEPRSPAEISESGESGAVLSRLVVVIGFLGGIVAGPFVAAVYLAIRLRPAPRPIAPSAGASHRGVPARNGI